MKLGLEICMKYFNIYIIQEAYYIYIMYVNKYIIITREISVLFRYIRLYMIYVDAITKHTYIS